MERVAFLFDNDGVLIDSSDLHWNSWKLLMKEKPALSMDKKAFLGGFGKRNELILKEVASHLEDEHEEIAKRKEELFRQCARGRVALLPGIEAFLQELKKRKIPRIIASSTPVENLKMYVETTVLGDYFDKFVSGEEVPQGKPAPDVFIEAAARLGFDPKDCIVLEDAPAGLKAATRAGCFVVALGTTHERRDLDDYDLYYPTANELNLDVILAAFQKREK